MKRRMIDGGIWANEKFAELPPMARLLHIGLINLADDQGRVKAHPAYLRSQLFPYDDVSLGEISDWLCLIAENGTLARYEVDGKEYLQLLNWWEYQSLQYASPSEYPRPDGWLDRIRYNAKGGSILTNNWTTPRGDQPTDTCDQDGNPLSRSTKTQVGSHVESQVESQVDTHVGGTNKDQIKINTNKDQGRDHARATETVETPTEKQQPLPPSLAIFRNHCTKPINNSQQDAIASTVSDLRLWEHVLTEWGLRGYNMGNVRGQLDWYLNGIPETNQNGAKHASGAGRYQSSGGDDAPPIDPEIERQFAERAERRRAEAAASP